MPVEKMFGLEVGQEVDIIKGKHDGHKGYAMSFTEKMVVVQVSLVVARTLAPTYSVGSSWEVGKLSSK